MYEQYLSELNIDGITFPMTIGQLRKFEKQNPDISVNVLASKDCGIVPLYVIESIDTKHQIDLLLIHDDPDKEKADNDDDDDDDGEVEESVLEPQPHDNRKAHFVLITNISALVCDRSDHKTFVHVYRYCLRPYENKGAHDRHLNDCNKVITTMVIRPLGDPT